MRITGIETRQYRFPLDPPFKAAWDPEWLLNPSKVFPLTKAA